jgi:Ca2+-binding RTX toxin-like protein
METTMARYFYGNAYDNTLYGTTRQTNYIYGYEGNDVIYGGTRSDGLYGGWGNDTIYGGRGNDWINGQEGDDVIFGGSGRDFIYDGEGYDTIYGGSDSDTIYLSADDQIDYVNGGSGKNDVVDLSDVTLTDSVYAEDNYDGSFDLFWQDLTGLWQQDKVANVEWIKDGDGLFLRFSDVIV